MLTKHQEKHLNAVINDTINHSKTVVGTDVANQMAKEHDVDTRDYQDYLDDIRDQAQAMLDSGNWPEEVKEPHEIHDYIEENKSFRPFEGGING